MDAIYDVIARLERQREAIDQALAALRAVGEGVHATTKQTVAKRGRKRRGPSAEGRRRIAEAQRARWAKKKAAEAAGGGKRTFGRKGPRRKTTAAKAA